MISAMKYLLQVRKLDIAIRQRMQQLEELEDKAVSLGGFSSDGDRVQSSGSGDHMADDVARYLDLRNGIQTLIDRLVRVKNKVIGEIQQIEDPRYMELLYLRYVKFKRLEEIADIMKKPNGDAYSYDHIRRLHGRALQEFQKKILKRDRNATK